MGHVAQQSGDAEAARAHYRHALDSGTDREAAEASYRLGVMAERENDPQAAEAWYRRAMHYANGGNYAALAAGNLGVMLFKSGDREAAHALFQQAVDGAGDRRVKGYLTHLIGDLLRREGALAAAEPLLRQAIEAGRPGARQGLARTLVGLERPEEAVELLREAADHDGDVQALLLLGDLLTYRVDPGMDMAGLFAHGNLIDFVRGYAHHLPAGPEIAEAERCYRQAAAYGMSSALVDLGHLLMGTGRTAEAETVLRQAVRGRAVNAEAVLGALLHLRGDDDEAARVLEPAVAAGNPMALIIRADIDSDADRCAEAVDLLRRALARRGALLGAGGVLFINLLALADLEAAEETVHQMLATGDRTGLAIVRRLMSHEADPEDSLRRAREVHGAAAVDRFTEALARVLQDRPSHG